MPRRYVPDRGDLVWLQFTPQAGHEQAGHRPAVVRSPRSYNLKSGIALFCPITGQLKGYPFEVEIPPGMQVRGAVLCDQIKRLDWSARGATWAGTLPRAVLSEVLAKALTLLQ